jgi:hypothetical protein
MPGQYLDRLRLPSKSLPVHNSSLIIPSTTNSVTYGQNCKINHHRKYTEQYSDPEIGMYQVWLEELRKSMQ